MNSRMDTMYESSPSHTILLKLVGSATLRIGLLKTVISQVSSDARRSTHIGIKEVVSAVSSMLKVESNTILLMINLCQK